MRQVRRVDLIWQGNDVKQYDLLKKEQLRAKELTLSEEYGKDKEGFRKKMKGPRMDTYENLMIFVNGKDTGALMRRLDDGKNTKDGKLNINKKKKN